MLLMLAALLGAVLVMAVGMAVVRWGVEYQGTRAFETDGVDSLSEPDGVGGYWPFPVEATEQEPVLPPHVLARVRILLAEGRETEAVEAVREATGMDLYRAREAVALVRRNGTG